MSLLFPDTQSAAAFYRIGKEAAERPELSYGLAGRLYLSKSGWILLSVPNALARGAFEALYEPGAELPVDDEGVFNAHVSVLRPEEIERIPGGADAITERGKVFRYTLGPVRSVVPHGWAEMSRCWFIEVNSPELEKFRKSYGLSALPKDGEFRFHCTFAVRRKGVLRENEVSKAGVPDREDADTAEPGEDQNRSSETRKAAAVVDDLPDREEPIIEDDPAEDNTSPILKSAGAMGIPDRSDYGDLAKLQQGQLLDLIIQAHNAQRAGPHFDFRLGSPELGLYSWATRKELPKPGERPIGFYRQPVHCFPPQTPVLTDRGWLPIGEIVNNRLPVRVLSCRDDGTLIWQPVMNFWRRPCDEPLVKLRLAGAFHRHMGVTCTRGHQIYTPAGKVAAGNLRRGDRVLVRLPYPSDDQWQIILGGLLGDASLAADGRYHIGHSTSQQDYFQWKRQALGVFLNHVSTRRNSVGAYSRKEFLYARGVSDYPPFVDLAKELYVTVAGRRVKRVTKTTLDKIGPLGLAVWYQDDGSRQVVGRRFAGCSLATHGFSPADVAALLAWLRDRWGLVAKAVSRGVSARGVVKQEIRLGVRHTLRFWDIIRGYVHPSLSYKVQPPAEWGRHLCGRCGQIIVADVKERNWRPRRICDSCLLEHLRRTGCQNETEYDKQYRRSCQGFAPRTYRLRFGSFAAAIRLLRAAAEETSAEASTTACGVIESNPPGARLENLSLEPSFRALALRVVSNALASDHRGFNANTTTLYNLEAAVNHNYFVAGGILVGNSHAYGDYEGIISRGYGAGEVRRKEKGKVLVTKVTPHTVHFTLAHRKHPERFVVVRPDNAKREHDWLLINVTPREGLPYQKIHYQQLPAQAVESSLAKMQPGTAVQTKIDGASSLIRLLEDGAEVLSYRTAKETGRPILHTERFGAPSAKIPKPLVGSVLRGELYGVRAAETEAADEGGASDRAGGGILALGSRSGRAGGGGGNGGLSGRGVLSGLSAGDGQGRLTAISLQELGGLLNATVENSLRAQRERGIQLRNALFDVQQLGSTPVDFHKTPYAERRKMLEDILPFLPQGKFHLAEQVDTPEAARALWEQIRTGQHPEGHHEGIVIHPPTGKPMKAKLRDEHDVHIVRVVPGEGKYKGTAAGGFAYALEPGGPEIGLVGTGFGDETRRAMLANPEDYVGRVARVIAQEQFPSGALRAPAFLGLHEDYPGKEAANKRHIPTVGVDFDGTIAEASESFEPDVMKLKPRRGARKALKEFQDAGYRVIIFTVRGDKQAIKDWCHEHDIPIDYVNENPDQPPDTSGKVIADCYLDDKAVSAEGSLATAADEVKARLEKDGDAPFYRRGIAAQLHQPEWLDSRPFLQNVLANVQGAYDRGRRMVTEADNFRAWQAAQHPLIGLQMLQERLASGEDPVVTDPIDRLLYRVPALAG